jgi:hypothetical protein
MMAIDERTRHELHQRLDEVLGAHEAATLMAHLPPTGWGDVVTREHLDMAMQAQDTRLGARFELIDARFEQVERTMDARFEQLEHAMDARFEQLQTQLAAARHELLAATRGELVAALAQQTRQMIVAMIGTVLSLAALARFI